MTSRQRMLAAIQRKIPDILPVTTHHVMQYFLDKYMNGMSNIEFFDYFGFDAIHWTTPHICDSLSGEYYDPNQEKIGFLESRRIITDNWRFEYEKIADQTYETTRYRIITPKGTLTTINQANEYTNWVTEHLIKEKKDIEIIDEFMTTPKCDVATVNEEAKAFGDRGIVRGHIPCFEIFGQPGCWQDACCLVGTERLIMETYDDPEWVHQLLTILQRRKLKYIQSMKGAQYDLMELGGGDASTTVISPKIFNEFVAPYDSALIRAAHNAGQRIAYHVCGGIMPILEDLAAMKPDTLETFSPPGMGGDTDLAEAKRRIGDKVCMIGGFDQFHNLKDCTIEETRAAVRKCFEQAGDNGGFILSPSDHFFDADPVLIKAFVDEARKCIY
jgi:uroporphyrinogen decarboxylase